MRKTDVVIATSEGAAPPNKLVRITASRDASHYVMVPYYQGNPSGILAKMRFPTIDIELNGLFAPYEEAYRVDGRVKLAIHSSGFVQFSSADKNPIRSGRTEPFGIPKGLGIHAPPLTQPIETGPTWSVLFFDPGECKQLDPQLRAPKPLIFAEADFFDREEHHGEGSHMHMVEGFVLPATLRREARYIPNKGWVLVRPYSVLRPDWLVEFRLVDLPSSLAMLGIVVSRMHMPHHAKRGFSMSSPRDVTRRFSLAAMYPATDETLSSMEFVPGSDAIIVTPEQISEENKASES